MKRRFRVLRGFALGALALLGFGVSAHFAIGRAARLTPPAFALPALAGPTEQSGVRHFAESYVTRRGSLLEVGLRGDPALIGFSQTRLLRREMVENEGILLARFHEKVPSALARTLLLDLAALRYRNVDREMSAERLLEIAGGARGFEPDPYAELFPTFQRFVYLNALYDISLSFEHSPLIGCTTFTFGGEHVANGSGILARAFDFEVDDVFDRGKAVFLVRERGKLPFASVAWPGLVGVVSGMNVEGVAVVVHGGRAAEPRTSGEPVVHALRRVLSEAHSSEEAIELLAQREPMVSHIVIVDDRQGRAAAIERAPGQQDNVRFLPVAAAATTNHFEGKLAEDPKNLRVREQTSTLPRRARADELLERLPTTVTPEVAARLLRDRSAVGGAALSLGDRRAIDALIATHGVVMETGPRRLWVSEAPHLLGRFVAFDLLRVLADDYDPEHAPPLEALAADPLLASQEYTRFRAERAAAERPAPLP